MSDVCLMMPIKCLMMCAGVHPPDGGQLFHQSRLPPGPSPLTMPSQYNYTQYKVKYTFLVITSHGVYVLIVDVIQLTASNI